MIYAVITPEYGKVVPVLDYGSGPIEYVCDYVIVDCDKRDAKALGVKLLRDQYPDGWIADAECPFTGLTVEPVCPRCWNADEPCVECEGEFEGAAIVQRSGSAP